MKKFFADFKAFISRGNVLDMAVGVIIGGAFNAIVTALVNILLSVATWGVPGGLKGLITVLPAVNDVQKGAVGQTFQTSEIVAKTIEYAAGQGVTITKDSDTFIQWQNSLLTKYTLHGTTYAANTSAVIDWGAFINAIISFLIIAITLFVIIKVAMGMAKKREELKAKMAAEAYQAWAKAHPEEAKAKEEAEAKAKAEAEAAAAVVPATTDDVVKLLAEISAKLDTKKAE